MSGTARAMTPGPWTMRRGMGGGKYWHIAGAAHQRVAVVGNLEDAHLVVQLPALVALARDLKRVVEAKAPRNDDLLCVDADVLALYHRCADTLSKGGVS